MGTAKLTPRLRRADQRLCQILAPVLQHLVDGRAAFIVAGVDVGAVFDEKLMISATCRVSLLG